MNKKTEEKIMLISIIIMLLFLLVAFISIFIPRLYEIYGLDVSGQILKFIGLLILTIGFVFLAREQLKEDSDEESFIGRVFVINNSHLRNFIKIAFHLLPLYFTLFVIKIDLLNEFKAVLIVFSWVAFLLVELNYQFHKIFNASAYIIKKLGIKNGYLLVGIFLSSFVVFLIAVCYVGYKLVIFYVNRF